jgi:outer membrane protein assembly factor BamB
MPGNSWARSLAGGVRDTASGDVLTGPGNTSGISGEAQFGIDSLKQNTTGVNGASSGTQADTIPENGEYTAIASVSFTTSGYIGFSGRGTGIFAFDPVEMSVQWRINDTGNNSSTQPAIANGVGYMPFSSTDEVVAYDMETGNEQWSFGLDGRPTSALTYKNDVLYLGDDSNAAYAIDTDGNQVWKTSNGLNNRPRTAIAATDSAIYIASDQGQVSRHDPSDGSVDWTFSDPSDVTNGAVFANGTVYTTTRGGDGNLYAINADDGTEKWSTQIGYQNAPPAYSDGLIYTHESDTAVYALNESDGSENWSDSSYSPKAFQYGSTTVAADTLLVPGDKELVAHDKKDGSILWRFTNISDEPLTPTSVDGISIVNGLNTDTIQVE